MIAAVTACATQGRYPQLFRGTYRADGRGATPS